MLPHTVFKNYYHIVFNIIIIGAALLIMVSTLLGGVTGFENHIPGRAALIDLAVRIRLSLGDRVYTQVLIGKDGYLEYINQYLCQL
jgi:hypothetical protein